MHSNSSRECSCNVDREGVLPASPRLRSSDFHRPARYGLAGAATDLDEDAKVAETWKRDGKEERRDSFLAVDLISSPHFDSEDRAKGLFDRTLVRVLSPCFLSLSLSLSLHSLPLDSDSDRHAA